ncbi:spry domain-containing socs box protein [Anaeramoeba flamelloides]|uniref:Spry domain-containing socs box protein n=1 Tax=Anaeramoeba flamelloides TaxID=1746091 RepID=A0ABQ8XFM3_9EUKA|nr:spry domain-containing socs box protein [Anaeramoeba flamelloides]
MTNITPNSEQILELKNGLEKVIKKLNDNLLEITDKQKQEEIFVNKQIDKLCNLLQAKRKLLLEESRSLSQHRKDTLTKALNDSINDREVVTKYLSDQGQVSDREINLILNKASQINYSTQTNNTLDISRTEKALKELNFSPDYSLENSMIHVPSLIATGEKSKISVLFRDLNNQNVDPNLKIKAGFKKSSVVQKNLTPTPLGKGFQKTTQKKENEIATENEKENQIETEKEKENEKEKETETENKRENKKGNEKIVLSECEFDFLEIGNYEIYLSIDKKLLPNYPKNLFVCNTDIWNYKTQGDFMKLLNKGKTVFGKDGNDYWEESTICGKTIMKTGKYIFRVKIEKCGYNLYLGVCQHGSRERSFLSKTAWFFDCFKGGKVTAEDFLRYDKPIKEGHVLGIEVDMDTHSLTFWNDQKRLGVAFKNLPNELVLAVHFRRPGQKVTII